MERNHRRRLKCAALEWMRIHEQGGPKTEGTCILVSDMVRLSPQNETMRLLGSVVNVKILYRDRQMGGYSRMHARTFARTHARTTK